MPFLLSRLRVIWELANDLLFQFPQHQIAVLLEFLRFFDRRIPPSRPNFLRPYISSPSSFPQEPCKRWFPECWLGGVSSEEPSTTSLPHIGNPRLGVQGRGFCLLGLFSDSLFCLPKRILGGVGKIGRIILPSGSGVFVRALCLIGRAGYGDDRGRRGTDLVHAPGPPGRIFY